MDMRTVQLQGRRALDSALEPPQGVEGPPRVMKIYYTDEFVLPLPEGHRFPMEKYRLLREAVAAPENGVGGDLRVPRAATDMELRRVHSSSYLEGVSRGALPPRAMRAIGFPWSPGLVERSRRSVGATVEAATAALDDGASANLAGGTHHAFEDRGEGFCVFNDVVVAARALQASGRIRRAAVVDLDVHQGNGTAALCRDDITIFTVSVHGASNFPFAKEASDLDLPLPDGTGDEPFLEAVEKALDSAFDQGRPDLLFYLAGADPFEGDRLGRLSVTESALAERDRTVVRRCRAGGVPLAVVMAGGYGRNILDTVRIHLHSVKEVATLVGREPR